MKHLRLGSLFSGYGGRITQSERISGTIGAAPGVLETLTDALPAHLTSPERGQQ